MKLTFYKLGALGFMILGMLHTLFQFLKNENAGQKEALQIMKNTSIQLMGEHNLLQFYNGFSLAMGMFIFAYGLQAYVNKQPGKATLIVNIIVSIISIVLSVIYFHPLAYSFFIFSAICFMISFAKREL